MAYRAVHQAPSHAAVLLEIAYLQDAVEVAADRFTFFADTGFEERQARGQHEHCQDHHDPQRPEHRARTAPFPLRDDHQFRQYDEQHRQLEVTFEDDRCDHAHEQTAQCAACRDEKVEQRQVLR